MSESRKLPQLEFRTRLCVNSTKNLISIVIPKEIGKSHMETTPPPPGVSPVKKDQVCMLQSHSFNKWGQVYRKSKSPCLCNVLNRPHQFGRLVS